MKGMALSETPRRTRAKAQIDVEKYEPQAYETLAGGPELLEIQVAESFSGDISGEGKARFLQVVRADGSASFAGIERVVGDIAGRSGTFVLQDAGTVEGQTVTGEWFVVPGSGTGGLSGLRGEGGFEAEVGEGATAKLDYWFE